MNKFKDLGIRDWFKYRGRYYIKISPLNRGSNAEFQAIDLATGLPEFQMTGSPADDDFEVELIEKPTWATAGAAASPLVDGSLRFDTEVQREHTKLNLREAFPGVVFTPEDKPGGVFLLNYTARPLLMPIKSWRSEEAAQKKNLNFEVLFYVR